MKLMVTGAGGFVGAAVVRAAHAAGIEAVAVTRRPGPERLAHLADINRLTLDLQDLQAMRAALKAEKPDVIVHSAWSGLGGEARLSSAQIYDSLVPTCRFAEAAAEVGVSKFVGIGSQGEYGPLNRRISEEDLPRPNSLYGAAKLSSSYLTGEIARIFGMGFAWLRLFATYGPGDNPDWLIPSVIRQLCSGERPRTTLGTQKWDYLFIDDAAEGVLAAIQPEATGIFNLASGHPVAVRQIIEQLRDMIDPSLDLVFGEVPFGPNQIMHLEGSIEKLQLATGWSPRVELQAGLSKTVDAFRG